MPEGIHIEDPKLPGAHVVAMRRFTSKDGRDFYGVLVSLLNRSPEIPVTVTLADGTVRTGMAVSADRKTLVIHIIETDKPKINLGVTVREMFLQALVTD